MRWEGWRHWRQDRVRVCKWLRFFGLFRPLGAGLLAWVSVILGLNKRQRVRLNVTWDGLRVGQRLFGLGGLG